MSGLPTLEPGCHVQMNPLVRKARRRVHGRQKIEMLGAAAGLLPKLSPSALGRIFAGLEPTRRNLVEIPVRRVAILLDEQQLGVVAPRVAEKRNHRTGARMTNHLELARRAARKPNRIDVEIDDATAVDAPAADLPRLPVLAHAIGWPSES